MPRPRKPKLAATAAATPTEAQPSPALPSTAATPDQPIPVHVQDMHNSELGHSAKSYTHKPLSAEQRMLILQLKERNPTVSNQDIADLVGCSRESVRRIFEVTGAQVAALMRSYAVEATELWKEAATVAAGKGYHQPAKELLTHSGMVTPPETGNTGPSLNVQVVVAASPGTPSYQAAGAPALEWAAATAPAALPPFAPDTPFAPPDSSGESET